MDLFADIFKYDFLAMRSKGVLLLCFSSLLLAVVYQLNQLGSLQLKSAVLATESIPPFEFEMMNGLSFTNLDLPLDNKPIIFMYMDPTCHDCKEMVTKIEKYYTEFKNVHLYMITESDRSQVDIFWQNQGLSKYDNIQALLDKDQVMFKTFQLTSVPSFVIYDADFRLIKIIDDQFNFSIVVKYVRETNKKNSSTIF